MIVKEDKIIDGNKVEIYTMSNETVEVSFMNYGGAILSMGFLEDGVCQNIAVKYDDLSDYFKENGPYLNALIGPIAGRIQNAKYELDGKVFQLPQNNASNHLHGGPDGLHRKTFEVEVNGDEAVLYTKTTHIGFEGEFDYRIIYKLEGTCFSIDYYCAPSVKQVVNLTNHIYVNMAANLERSMEEQYLRLPSKRKVRIHKDGYPCEIVDIQEGSAFDFFEEKKIGVAYELGDPEFEYTLGIDAPFLLEDDRRVYVYDSLSTYELDVETDMECIVVYTSNYFNESEIYEGGIVGKPHCCVALETQAIPNGIHVDGASDSVHSSENPYQQHTKFTLVRRS